MDAFRHLPDKTEGLKLMKNVFPEKFVDFPIIAEDDVTPYD